MNKAWLALAALAASFLPHAAWAEDGSYTYWGLGYGAARISGPGMVSATGAGGGFYYGVRVAPSFAIEGALLAYPLAVTSFKTTSGANVDAASLGISALGFAPIADGTSLYGKLGYARPFSSIGDFHNAVGGRDKAGVSYGIGVEFLEENKAAVTLRIGVDRLPGGVFSNSVKVTNLYFMVAVPTE